MSQRTGWEFCRINGNHNRKGQKEMIIEGKTGSVGTELSDPELFAVWTGELAGRKGQKKDMLYM